MGGNETLLDKFMDARRRELKLRWKDVADGAGLSEETIRLVRRGKRDDTVRTTDTESRIERALYWARGSIQAIRDGREPIPLPGSPTIAAPGRPPMDGAWAPWQGAGVPADLPGFVGEDPGYQALWSIPEELLSAEERKWAILQIGLRRKVEREE